MNHNSFSLPASQRGGSVFRKTRYGNQRPAARRQGAYINPDRFVNKAAPAAEQVRFVPEHAFADFGFKPELQANIAAHGYVHPTPIQDGAIPVALKGGDVIGLANTGTGKTAAFLLPLIDYLMVHKDEQALIVAPTRELAVQIQEEFIAFARGLRLFSAICVGGASMGQQIATLRRRPQVVIGTPGRLKDLVNQRVLNLSNTTRLVLDEADRMLDMGFIKDIQFLIDLLPKQRQSLFFSATLNTDIKGLVAQILTNPVTISVITGETSDTIEQNVISARSKEDKLDKLVELLYLPEFDKVLVFGQTKWGVQRLAEQLVKTGFKAEAIHGNKTQPQRQRALKAFKDGHARILVATDVAARGLDIPNVSHVINFDQPNTYDDYVHRIGRTGRAGQRGHALTFVG